MLIDDSVQHPDDAPKPELKETFRVTVTRVVEGIMPTTNYERIPGATNADGSPAYGNVVRDLFTRKENVVFTIETATRPDETKLARMMKQ